jgi:site-specific DNA-methyltransferase (adenine-specific)
MSRAGNTSGNNPAKRSADKHQNVYAGWKGERCLVHRGTDSGGASRFFYTSKADRQDRGEGNTHPTVKPQDLIEYLIKLVSRPGAIILDPFSGSGTVALVADKMNRRGIGMDLERKYCELGNRRCYDDAPLLAVGRREPDNG